MMWRGVVAALAAVLVMAVAACSDASEPQPVIPADLVPGEPGDYRVIAVDGVVVPGSAELIADLVPILTAREFTDPAPLADYGLDRPRFEVSFVPVTGDPVTFEVGGENFDGSGYYVRRHDDRVVRLVLDDSLDPILDRAGL